METEDCSNEMVPSLMMNSEVLSSTLISSLPTECYYIGDEEFYELPENNLCDHYVEFEMRAWKRSNTAEHFSVGQLSEEEKFVWTRDESGDDESENGEEFMDIHIKERPNGVIINSNVYLTMYQWNTIILDDVIIHCFICDDYMDKITLDSHIKSSDHKLALTNCKPLVKYELSVTREARNKYHCGTCNVIVEKNEETDHYSSELHGNNLLSAINKVSDFADEFIEKNSDESVDNDDSYDNDCDFNADHEIWDNEWVKAVVENPGSSYANKLKKAVDAPEYYDVNVGYKKVRVTYDCWHMLIKPKDNSFYCMVCKDYYRITIKNRHCADSEHLGKLQQCSIVEKFGEYFVRQIDDMYHCGRCNSLQLKGDIDNHLEYRHNRKPNNVSEAVVLREPHASTSNDNMNNMANANTYIGPSTSKRIESESPYKDVLVNHYDLKIYLPYFNYNAILMNFIPGGLHCCGVCNIVYADKNLLMHTKSDHHMNLLKQSPFIRLFSLNMIRCINGTFHCAICNVFVMQNLIYKHIKHPYHIQMMDKILNNSYHNNIPSANNTNWHTNFKPIGINKTNPELANKNKINKTNLDLTNKNKEKIKKKSHKQEEHKKDYVSNKLESEENLNTSFESDESVIDLDSYVYVKFKAVYLKITFTSYNSLVPIGDGRRYCFVCSTRVQTQDIKRHVESRNHVKNMNDCYFLDMFEGELLRQIYITFHCGLCNVPMSRSQIKDHLTSPQHVMKMESSKVPSRVRKNEIKNNVPMYEVKVGKEMRYEHAEEPVTKILKYHNSLSRKKVGQEKNIDKYKMITINENILKLPMSSWHGVIKVKERYRCVLCQKEIEDEKEHVKTQEHDVRVHKPFMKEHMTDLLREVNNNVLHCLICNAEISNVSDVISKHIEGKKHKKKYILIKESSENADNYTDCDINLLQLWGEGYNNVEIY